MKSGGKPPRSSLHLDRRNRGACGPPKVMNNASVQQNALGPATVLHGSATLPFVIPRACDFFDLFLFFTPDQMVFSPLQKGVILRACDFFDLFLFFAPDQMLFNPLQKGVILSEAPRRPIA